MLARQLRTVIGRRKSCGYTLLRDEYRLRRVTRRAYGIDHEKIMHDWRETEADLNRSKSSDNPNKSKKIAWHPTDAPTTRDFSIGNIVNWYAAYNIEAAKYSQQFKPERHDILGADLASAHFVLSRGGRVRFKGDDHWTGPIERGKKDTYKLPNKYEPQYILEAVDVNGYDLYYEGLCNLVGLSRLKWLSLKGCKNIDDWGLDKISAEYPQLEHLDISDCAKITERGLEGLYKMFTLKRLVVTNHHKSAALELTCMMLEDCVPGLTCEILMPEEKSKD